ncbi:dATP/dGTP pyrophosphohydrolase domain-containing protein, partial [Klebsiella pneumoniae]|uniref:dATP/dGTP pyrophosphohydrolase domain-containing protein n=1 Tax=Klebsiella pneumoniae TaxID=573 RepID=UPI000E354B20
MADITELARERLKKIKSWRETYGAGSNVILPAEEAEALARMVLDAMDRDQVRQEHAEWSQVTFGNVGPVGPLNHLSKEALEAAAEPCDLSEWADMQFL